MLAARTGRAYRLRKLEAELVPWIHEREYDSVRQLRGRVSQESVANPTAFETRNTGVTLEVEPNISENDYVINLKILPEIVEFEGFTVRTIAIENVNVHLVTAGDNSFLVEAGDRSAFEKMSRETVSQSVRSRLGQIQFLARRQ